MGNIIRILGLAVAFLCLVIAALLGTLAIYYSNLPPALRPIAAVSFALVAMSLILLGLRKRKRRAWGAFLVLFAMVVAAWWLLIPPSNSRNWQPDVAVLPWAEVRENLVTVHNIRNCDYRTETDYTVSHYDRSFDLPELDSVDLLSVYWMGPDIAHVMLSFGFARRDYLAVSIEVRKEKGEAYSTVKGFFRQYELYYVVADERDVVRVRTHHRHDPPEDVYRFKMPTVYVGARLLGGSTTLAWMLQGMVMLGVTAGVAWVWRRDAAPAYRNAVLIVGTLLFPPFLFYYDLALLAMPLAWLTWEGLSRDGKLGNFISLF